MKLSFVIPCYKAESYVDRCLESILAVASVSPCKIGSSDYDFEIICVNDCSPDGTSGRLHALAGQHCNITVLDLEENMGWGGARTAGLLAATGEYIWYVDVDDTIVPDAVSSLLEKSLIEKLDVLGFNYNDLSADGSLLRQYKVFENIECSDGLGMMKKAFGKNLANNIGYVWRFLYRRQFLLENCLLFPEKVCWEDSVYMPKALILASRAGAVDIFAYNYWHSEDSACRTFVRTYPGKLLYELVFCAGYDLWQLAEEIEDEDISGQITRCVKREYFNYFPIFLSRAPMSERCVFYKCVREGRKVVKECLPFMKPLPRACLLRCVGPIVSEMVSIAYRITHTKR